MTDEITPFVNEGNFLMPVLNFNFWDQVKLI